MVVTEACEWWLHNSYRRNGPFDSESVERSELLVPGVEADRTTDAERWSPSGTEDKHDHA